MLAKTSLARPVFVFFGRGRIGRHSWWLLFRDGKLRCSFVCTFCRVQDDPKGFWAFHRPFSAPRGGSGMCVFFCFLERKLLSPIVAFILFWGRGER